jgi:two-component system response regulator
MLAENYSRQVSILLVEDNDDDVLLTLRAFKKNTVELEEVVVVRDGAEAMDFLFTRGSFEQRNQAIMPRLILLDIKLPKMNGLELLRTIRSDPRTRLIPVVMLTSSAAEQDLLSCYGAGANGYIQKPVNSREFEEVVQQVVTYWLGVNRAPGTLSASLQARL